MGQIRRFRNVDVEPFGTSQGRGLEQIITLQMNPMLPGSARERML